MDDVKKTKAKSTMILLIGVVAALVTGVVATVICYCTGDNKTLLSLGTGFTAFFLAMAVYFAVAGAVLNRKASLLLAIVCGFFGFVLLMIVLRTQWFITLIVAIALAAIALFGVLMLYNNKTTLVFDNEKEEYKDYKTRKAERDAAEKEKPEEELPEIKSFK